MNISNNSNSDTDAGRWYTNRVQEADDDEEEEEEVEEVEEDEGGKRELVVLRKGASPCSGADATKEE